MHTLACCCCRCLALCQLFLQGLFDGGVKIFALLLCLSSTRNQELVSAQTGDIKHDYFKLLISVQQIILTRSIICNSQSSCPGSCGNCQIAQRLPNCLEIAKLPDLHNSYAYLYQELFPELPNCLEIAKVDLPRKLPVLGLCGLLSPDPCNFDGCSLKRKRRVMLVDLSCHLAVIHAVVWQSTETFCDVSASTSGQ